MAVGGQLQRKSELQLLCDPIMIRSKTLCSPRRVSPDATSEIHRHAQFSSSLRTRKPKGKKAKDRTCRYGASSEDLEQDREKIG